VPGSPRGRHGRCGIYRAAMSPAPGRPPHGAPGQHRAAGLPPPGRAHAPLLPPWGPTEEYLVSKINTVVPHSSRVWNYWLGGKDHYPADQEAGDACLGLYPGTGDAVRALRYLSARVVRYLADEAGVRQFLDVGTGIPPRDAVHEIAQSAAPGSRVVYADNDPLALAHARALLTGPAGTTGYADADLNDPAALLEQAAALLDFTQPVAILLFSVLGHVGDPRAEDDQAARKVTGELSAALPPGGFLAIGDLAAHPALDSAMAHYRATGADPYHLRAPFQAARLLEGLELTGPGIMPACQWRPDPSPFPPADLPAWGGVGRKA
jgi:SAM-dependent methyltransferase